MKKIKAAVIGTGFIGPAHIEALRRIGSVEVHGIASLDLQGARSLAEKYSIPKVYDKWQDAVSDKEIDVIHNCTPNNLHFEINKAALKEGKHVISEKPLTLTSEESSELIRLAKEKGVVNAVNFNYRFYPLTQHARRMVEKGELGSIYLVHGHYLQDWLYYDTDYNWRLETEVSGESRAVADIGSHWCDLMQFITGSRIKRVCADLLTVHTKRKRPLQEVATFKGKEEKAQGSFEDVEIKTEDAGSVLLQFENGARGVFTVSQVSAGRKNNFVFEIDGSKKAISWDQEEPNELWVGYREKANEVLIKDPSLLDEEARRYAHYPGGHPEGYSDGPKNLFMNVYDFILKGKDPLKDKPDFPTFEDGHLENKIVEAILRSSKEEKWIEV
ncbi:MAG TPA: Gfo/Idh/MocA family oxidoreductase [Ignavibacteriales bacterium]|nr:Gfo/Idh/MocA family oxidoreductase [Ignavibacteriales bacterium]